MITYKRNKGQILVFLDNVRAGTIRPVKGGFQYFPWRKDIGGRIFKTIEEVKHSLETEND